VISARTPSEDLPEMMELRNHAPVVCRRAVPPEFHVRRRAMVIVFRNFVEGGGAHHWR